MNDLITILPKLQKSSVLVIGDIMVDKFMWGQVSRISPEAPVPVVEITKETQSLGGAANVASNITALGAKAYLIGVIGDDAAGDDLLSMLKDHNIQTDYLITNASRPTSLKTRIIATNQQVVRVDKEMKGAFDSATEKKVISYLEDVIKKIDGIIISDYGKGIINSTVLKKTIALAHKHSIPVTVDPKIEYFKSYKNITCMTPNTKEAVEGMAYKKDVNKEENIKELGRNILKTLKAKSIIITRGEKGMTLFEPNGKTTDIPTRAKEVFDVTGAGDTVIAVLTLCLSSKVALYKAAEIANFAAGIVVGKRGTATTNMKELKSSIETFYKK